MPVAGKAADDRAFGDIARVERRQAGQAHEAVGVCAEVVDGHARLQSVLQNRVR